MKSYIVGPNFELPRQPDDRTRQALELVADVLFKSLRSGEDTFQFSVVWVDPGKEPGTVFHGEIAQPRLFELADEVVLRSWLGKSLDPYSAGGGVVRSAATCRCAVFGYDGQALLCLRHEDGMPITPNADLVYVVEKPELVRESDWFDGWVRESGD